MKIAFTHLDLTTESGDPKHLLALAQGLQKHGHKVIIYCAGFDAERCFPRLNQGLDIRVLTRDAKQITSPQGSHNIIGKIRERVARVMAGYDFVRRAAQTIDRDFDLLIVENDRSYPLAARYRQINPAAKLVWILHNPPFFHSPKKNLIVEILSRIVAAYERHVAKQYGAVFDTILVFDKVAKSLVESAGLPAQIAYLPFDADYFTPKIRSRTNKRRVQLLSLGALSPARRYEDTIATVALLVARGYDARSILICKDYWGDAAYRKQFEKYIANSGVGDRIDARFVGSTEEELRQAMYESDIFVLPNNVALWAIGAAEGMATGLPLILSRSTAMAEYFHDGVDALFVDPLRPDQIADHAAALMDDPLLCEKISSAGEELVRKDLSVDGYISTMFASIKE